MFTVKDFLDMNLLPWYKIFYGQEQLDLRFIEYASSLELPIEHFARKNELVLSSLVGCENKDSFLELIRDVHMAGSSAILISRPEDQVVLPEAVCTYLEAHPFPVILIPWHIRFADIIEAVSKRIQNDTGAKIARYEQIQKSLLEGYLSNEDINCAAELLAAAFQSQIYIFDSNGNRKGGNFPSQRQGEPPHDGGIVIEIKANERLYGSLHLWPLGKKTLYDEALFYHYLIWPLVLWFDREWIIQATNQSVKDDFIWKLAKGITAPFDQICEEGQRLGFYLRGSYTCIVGELHLYNGTSAPAGEQWITANINLLKEEILQTARSARRRVMVTYQQKLLIIFFQGSGSPLQRDVHSYLDKLEQKISTISPQLRFAWGISGPGGDPTDFRKCYQDAKLAQSLCVSSPSKSTRYTFENTVIYNLISHLHTDPAIVENIKHIVDPLAEYDLSTGSSLMRTLQCYLECKNLSEAARLLHLHRQSLLYRVNKIEELTGLTLKNADDFFLLEVCVRMYSSQS